MSIQDKVALVTGASRGIGRGVALELSSRGAKVVVNYNSSTDAAQQVVDAIRQQGGEAMMAHADVSSLEQVNAMVEQVIDTWGSIDILVNNAGIIKDNLLMRMSDDDWHRVIDVNLNGTFYCSRAVIRPMVRQRWGRIVNIGSVVGLRGNPGQANYAAAKAGIIGFTKALAKEVASRGVTVNTVTPGYISTDVVEIMPQAFKDGILERTPMGEFGAVEDVSHIVAFLASQEARYITGQAISVDGGLAI